MQKPLTIILLLFIIVFSAGVLVSIVYFPDMWNGVLNKNDFSEHTIYANDNVPIHVIVADTSFERQLGLGNRDMLAVGQGMLFVFDENKKWRIWMKDMHFGLDIIWLDENGRIVDIRDHVYPESYEKTIPDVFEPKEKARYVLEVLVGFSDANGIRVGGVIKLGSLSARR